MPNVGPMEIGLVLIIALIVFGPKKLPDLGHSLGKGIREFKGSINGEDEAPRVTEGAAPATAEKVSAPAESHTA
jgi:sec-independent protein translocase protein TatA